MKKLNCLVLAYSDIRYDPRILKQCQALSDSGYEVNYFGVSFDEERSVDLKKYGFKVNLLFKRGKGKFVQALEYLLLMLCFMFFQVPFLTKKPVVIVHNMPNFLVLSTIFLRVFGAKVILDLHDDTVLAADKITNIKIFKRIFSFIENKVALYIPHTILTVNRNLQSKFQNISGKDVSVIHNCPNIEECKEKKDYSVSGRLKLVFIGHVGSHYGLDRLIQFVCKLNKTCEVSLDVYGDGEELEKLKKLSTELDAFSYVRFHGRYQVSDLPNILSLYDVGVAPYPQNSMTHVLLPVKILEYTLNKLPVISTKLQVAHQYFGDDSLIWANDYDDYEYTIHKILDGRIELEEVWQRTHKLVEPLMWKFEKEKFLKLVNQYGR